MPPSGREAPTCDRRSGRAQPARPPLARSDGQADLPSTISDRSSKSWFVAAFGVGAITHHVVEEPARRWMKRRGRARRIGFADHRRTSSGDIGVPGMPEATAPALAASESPAR